VVVLSVPPVVTLATLSTTPLSPSELNEIEMVNEEGTHSDRESLLPISSPKQKTPRFNVLYAILSCCLYSVCSVSMVLTNKVISTTVVDKSKLPQYSIILFQCLLATIFVEGARFFNIVEYAPFNVKTAIAWLPLNILFICMLCSGFFSLIYVSVPMVTIFKNLTNLVTVWGDYYFFGEM